MSNVLPAGSVQSILAEDRVVQGNPRASGTSSDTKMHVKLDTRQTPLNNHGHCVAKIVGEDIILSCWHRKQEGREFFDNKVSPLNSENNEKALSNHSDTDWEDLSGSSTSVDCCHAMRKANNKNHSETHWEDLSGSSTSVDCHHAMGKVNNTNQVHWCCSARDELDVRPSNPTEGPIKVAEDFSFGVGSKKMDSSETSIRNSHGGARLASSSKGELSDISVDQAESSETKADTIQVDDHMYYLQNSCKMLEPDIEAECGKLASEDEKCLEHKVDPENFGGIKESTGWGPALQLQPLDCREKPNHLEEEVRVCDICGDVGREELLAICSKCSDGAEHIYCMRVKLEKVPESYWICEECILIEEKENREHMLKQDFAARSKAALKGRLRQKLGSLGFCNNKNRFKLEKTCIADCRRIRGSAPLFSSKRPFSSSMAISQKEKEGGPETSRKLITQTNLHRDTVMFQGASSENLEKRKTMSTYEGVSAATTMWISLLLRTKSISNNSTKVSFQQGNIGEKQDKSGKEEVRKMSYKSATVNCTSLDTLNASNSNVRKIQSNLPTVEDLKRLRHEKEQIQLGRNDTVASHTPSLRSMPACNYDSQLGGNKIIQKCKTSLPVLSGPISSSSPTPAIGFADGDKDQNKFSSDTIQKPDGLTEVTSTKDKKSSGALAFDRLSHAEGLSQSVFKNSTSWMPALPECNNIWQGRFVIKKSGRPAASCDGIQAHLSSGASPKVFQIVCHCPPMILLEEVSRLDKWPKKSIEKQPKDDNIALYFFAKDLESYERYYRSLLDYLVKNDLCLKGDVNGVELLIFASNLLPERSQRWNNFLFFWGVLNERIPDCLHNLPAAQEGLQNSSFSSATSDSHNSCSPVQSSEIFSSSLNVQRDSNYSISSKAAVSAPAIVVNSDKTTFPQKVLDSATSDGRLNAPTMRQKSSGERVHHSFFQRELKRRPDIDLNKGENTNGTRQFGEEHKCRKMLISKELLDGNVLCEGYVHGLDCSRNGEESYGANSEWNWISSTKWRRERGIPSLELSLGWSKDKPAEQDAMKMFPEIEGHKNNGCSYTTGDENDEQLLSLSLSLSTSDKRQAPDRVMVMRPVWPSFACVDTSLSLSSF